MSAVKMGRPTESPKNYMLRVRFDEETLQKLDKIAEKENKSRSEVVRECIKSRYIFMNDENEK